MITLTRMLALLCFGTSAFAQAPKDDSLRVIFFDVGQGDAALVRTPEGKTILIDAGPSGERIVGYLNALNVKTLDLVIATHNHLDHIGGMADVFAAFQVREYMDNGLPALTKAYRRTVEAVEKEPGLKIRAATEREYLLDRGRVIATVMRPPHATGAQSQNDNSIGLSVDYGAFNATFTGDAEKIELDIWLRFYEFSRASVLKASHHGSANGVDQEWIDALRPKVLVISVGANNQYGHPSTDVLLAWSAVGARIYRTDAFGTIVVTAADSGGFTVTTTSGAMPWVSK